MNLTDLRDELDLRLDGLEADPAVIGAGVDAKVRATKRRRAAVAGAGATLAVAALAVGVVTSVGRPAPVGPAGAPSSSSPMIGADGMPYRVVAPAGGDITKDGLRLLARSADSLLAGGAIGDPGQRSLTLEWNPTTTRIALTVECYVPSATPQAAADLMVRTRIGSAEGYFASTCTPGAEPSGDVPAGGIVPGPVGAGAPGVTVGRTGVLSVDLVDSDNRPVSRADVRLVAGVYELGPQTPVRDAAQKVVGVVPDTLDHHGYTYRLSRITARPVADVARGLVELEAPESGPYLVTYGTIGIENVRDDAAYYTLDGVTGEAAQVQEGGFETVPQPAGRGQWLRVTRGMPDLGTAGTEGTAFIATYVLER